MNTDSRRPADPVSWDEAREIVSIVLLSAAVLVVLAPMIRFLADGSPYGLADTISTLFQNVGPVSGLLLVGSAVLVVTVPPQDVVPLLRRTIELVSVVIAAIGFLAVLVEVTSVTAPQPAGFFIRLSTMAARSLPGTMLAGLAAWLARNVVPFPSR